MMMDMKELYIQPRVEVVEVEAEEMLALSVNEEQASSEEDVLAGKRRGTWGNLWSGE